MSTDKKSDRGEPKKAATDHDTPAANGDDLPSPIERFVSLLDRVKGLKLVQWLAIYGAAAYTLLHGVEMVVHAFHWHSAIVANFTLFLFLLVPVFLMFVWYHGERKMRHVIGIEWAFLVVWACVSTGSFWWLNSTPASKLENKEIVVLAVMSGAVPYEKLILDSFRMRAGERLNEHGGKLDWKPQIDGYSLSPKSAEGKPKWNQLMADIRERYAGTRVDYLVGVGSFASIALKNSGLADALHADGMIFVGITDPVGAGLVSSLSNRRDKEPVAVVRYGRGGQKYGEYLASMFPKGQKLVFVYQQGGPPQDEYMAGELNRVPGISAYPYVGELNPDDLSDPDAIYFAWYGFDNLLSDAGQGGAALLKRKKVVPSTCTKENVDLAGIVVSVNDVAVGSAGAETMWQAIKAKHIDNTPIKLGERDVTEVDYQAWVNRATVKRKGIHLIPRGLQERENCPQLVSASVSEGDTKDE
jgi:hypothetical protein